MGRHRMPHDRRLRWLVTVASGLVVAAVLAVFPVSGSDPRSSSAEPVEVPEIVFDPTSPPPDPRQSPTDGMRVIVEPGRPAKVTIVPPRKQPSVSPSPSPKAFVAVSPSPSPTCEPRTSVSPTPKPKGKVKVKVKTVTVVDGVRVVTVTKMKAPPG